MTLEPAEKPGARCPFPLPPGIWPGFPQWPGFQESLACPSLLLVVQPSLARPSQVWKLFSETWRSPSAAGVVVPVQSTHQVTPPWVMRRGQLGAGDGWLCPLPTLPRDPDSTVSPEPRPGAGVAGEGPSRSPGVSWQGWLPAGTQDYCAGFSVPPPGRLPRGSASRPCSPGVGDPALLRLLLYWPGPRPLSLPACLVAAIAVRPPQDVQSPGLHLLTSHLCRFSRSFLPHLPSLQTWTPVGQVVGGEISPAALILSQMRPLTPDLGSLTREMHELLGPPKH